MSMGSQRTRALARVVGALSTLLIAASAIAAQPAPVVEKVEPPNWWTGSTVNPVRLLIRGQNLAGARFNCPRVSCSGRPLPPLPPRAQPRTQRR